MKQYVIIISIPLLIILGIFPHLGFAQGASSSSTNPNEHEISCKEQVRSRLTQAVDMYHRILYGSTGSTLTENKKTVLTIDGTMTEQDIRGILETKGRLTSELIPPLVESFRVLRCNLRAVCEQLAGTLQHGTVPATMKVEPLGCLEQELPVMDQCTYTNEPGLMHAQELQAYCVDVINKTLPVERSALMLAVSYDAGYRSNLQTIGMFDSFLRLLPTHLFRPLQQMVGLLGKLHQIPCFLTQCDAPPKP